MITTRPATKDDVMHFYPDITASFRAWVVELNGHVEAILGIVMRRPFATLVSVVNDALKPYLKHMAVLRLIKKVQGVCEKYKGPLVAIAEDGEEGAPLLLTRLGFVHYGVVDGDELYIWGGE